MTIFLSLNSAASVKIFRIKLSNKSIFWRKIFQAKKNEKENDIFHANYSHPNKNIGLLIDHSRE